MSVRRFDLTRRDYDDYEMVQAEDGDWVEAASVRRLSAALSDMIALYEGKRRDGIRLGNARAALNLHGIAPLEQDPTPAESR